MLPGAGFLVDISSRYLTGNLLSSTQQEKRVLLKTLKSRSVNTNWERAQTKCESHSFCCEHVQVIFHHKMKINKKM